MKQLIGLKIVGAVKDPYTSNAYDLELSNGMKLHAWPHLLTKLKPKAETKKETLADWLRKNNLHWYCDRRKKNNRIKICTSSISTYKAVVKLLRSHLRTITISRELLWDRYGSMFTSNSKNESYYIIIRTKHGVTPSTIKL